jgi:cobalamin biosynthesis Mg chelatase CobN
MIDPFDTVSTEVALLPTNLPGQPQKPTPSVTPTTSSQATTGTLPHSTPVVTSVQTIYNNTVIQVTKVVQDKAAQQGGSTNTTMIVAMIVVVCVVLVGLGAFYVYYRRKMAEKE